MSDFKLFPKQQGIFPYINLIYFLLPASSTFKLEGFSRILTFILLAVFLISYRQLYWQDSSHYMYSVLLGIQLTIILILIVFNFNYIFLGFFPASFIGWYPNKKYFTTAVTIYSIILSIPIYISLKENLIIDYIFILPFYMAMFLLPFGTRSLYKKQLLEHQLDEANAQIKELIKRDERIRIARDLHDTLGHTLSLITLKSQLVEKTIKNNPERALNEAKEIKNTSRLALKQVRELVSDMRALSISEALIEIKLILESAQIHLNLYEHVDINSIPRLTQNIISLSIKESVTNIVKHSQATICDIHIERDEGNLLITIQDNGIGILNLEKTNGNGLKGVSERLSLIEGSLSIKANNGTTIRLTIPIVIRNGMEEGKIG